MNGWSERRRVSRLIGGVLLLFLGGLFVLQNLGYVKAGNLDDYWPLLLIWIGVTRMWTRGGHFASGLVLLLMGVFFLLDRLDVFWIPMRQLWPVVLIVLGLGLIADVLIARRGRPALTPRSEAGPGGRS